MDLLLLPECVHPSHPVQFTFNCLFLNPVVKSLVLVQRAWQVRSTCPLKTFPPLIFLMWRIHNTSFNGWIICWTAVTSIKKKLTGYSAVWRARYIQSLIPSGCHPALLSLLSFKELQISLLISSPVQYQSRLPLAFGQSYLPDITDCRSKRQQGREEDTFVCLWEACFHSSQTARR